jgi:hypothetical protein
MVRCYQVMFLLLMLQVKLKGVCMCRIAASKSDSRTVTENLLLSIATRFRCFSLGVSSSLRVLSITLVTRILLLSKDKRLLN